MPTLLDALDDELAANNRRQRSTISPFYGRCVVVLAHPDDEVIGCGALISRLDHVDVVHVTDGSPRVGDHAARAGFASRSSYAAARAAEAAAALSLAGIPRERQWQLGLPDQGAQHSLGILVRKLLPHVARARIVFTHAYEGGHPDHDAVAFAVHTATAMIVGRPKPAIYEMPFYHGGPNGWIRQAFLPQRGAGAPVEIAVTPADCDLKRDMAACHGTQTATLRHFDLRHEWLRLAPRYDFATSAHDGPLLYQRYGGVPAATWSRLVREAQEECGMGNDRAVRRAASA